ncbi:MAG: N-acetyl-gamma-glutamyl-phosphate reductase, partial [Myxococcales bacterium]|nr:N-acetyl-gamma-glutamyl-phosphate reductase [Myxococcales bacterium]
MLYPQSDVAVVGATGYGGAELIRLLSTHPAVNLKHTIAIDKVGLKVAEVMPNLNGLTDLTIENLEPEQVEVDLVFLALPHRVSATIGARYQACDVQVVDLSGDWRLRDPSQYTKYYGLEHPFPERMGSYVYGLPELNRAQIAQSRCVASPGCFATATTLALLPFARHGLLQGRVRVSAMTGSSGSGAAHSAGTHHPVRSVNLKPYKPL